VFLTASPEARAGRRVTQRGDEAEADTLAAETAALEARDRADSSRAVAPLRTADDAILLDTTSMSFDDQVRIIVELARPIFGIRKP
jgi:cytidylate kinase